MQATEEIRQAVREAYGRVAEGVADGRCGTSSSCCGTEEPKTPEAMSRAMGYSEAELAAVPEGANLGLGCGNPQGIAALEPGETVLDLGSGGGFDCFLAAKVVGETGRVVGVDMTPEMVQKARGNAEKMGVKNVEFRLGEIEALPVADGSVDVILSNCVINLSPEKDRVFREAFRVLRPGGRLAVSDIVARVPLPEVVRKDLALYAGCVSGAVTIGELEEMLEEVGFVEVRITPEEESREMVKEWTPGGKIEDYVVSATIEGVKK